MDFNQMTQDHAAKVMANAQTLIAKMIKKAEGRPSAKWQSPADVDWDDLDYYIDKCKTDLNKESFDTAIKVLTALRSQVLERP